MQPFTVLIRAQDLSFPDTKSTYAETLPNWLINVCISTHQPAYIIRVAHTFRLLFAGIRLGLFFSVVEHGFSIGAKV